MPLHTRSQKKIPRQAGPSLLLLSKTCFCALLLCGFAFRLSCSTTTLGESIINEFSTFERHADVMFSFIYEVCRLVSFECTDIKMTSALLRAVVGASDCKFGNDTGMPAHHRG